MMQQSKLFSLTQLVKLSPDLNPGHLKKGHEEVGDDAIRDFCQSANGQAVVLVTRLGKIVSMQWVREGEEPAVSWRYHPLSWYQNPDLFPTCVTFNPEDDFILICSQNGQLSILHSNLVLPNFKPKGASYHRREWSSSEVNELPNELPGDPCFVPACVFWWSTHDFKSLAVIGTTKGSLVCIDLISGKKLCYLVLCDEPLKHLETIVDSTLDCTYLLISSQSGTQFKLLLEQRSIGYRWESCINSKPSTSTSSSKTKSTSEESLATQRSRLSGLKQMSAVGLATLRQRLSEGRKLLDRRMSSSSSNVDLGPESDLENNFVPLSLSASIGDTKVSVQKSKDGTGQVLAGIFPDTSVMTLHNSNLEVLPQTAFKLPRGTDRLLLLDKLIVTCTMKSQIHIVSAQHSELHLEANKVTDGVVQTFTLPASESIMGLFQCEDPDFSYLDCTEDDDLERPLSPPNSDFRRCIEDKIRETGRKSRGIFGRFIIITNQALYILQMEQNPVNFLLELTMRSRDHSQVEVLSSAFGLETVHIYELAADFRLSEKDFANAISLYRHAGCKHLKVVLKFASSGFVQELLSYLTVLFKTPNMEATPAERIHLSNLGLMAHFQQALTKSTPTVRSKFQEQIKIYLDENRWFDECLCVQLASETGEWDVLNHMAASRGVSFEMIQAIITSKLNEDKGGPDLKLLVQRIKEMSTTERNGLLSCLLKQGNIELVIPDETLAQNFLDVLLAITPILETPGLVSILEECSPLNNGLYCSYLKLMTESKTDSNVSSIGIKLLNLSIHSALAYIKKQQTSHISTDCDNRLQEGSLSSKEIQNDNQDSEVLVDLLAAGASHVVFIKNPGLVLTWGGTANGVLGQGTSGSRFSLPKVVESFRDLSLKVIAVTCGRAHTMALTNFGIYVWGSSKFGQLGLGKQRFKEQRPFLVKGLSRSNVISIAAGQYHSLALDDTGALFSWGWGVHGQLGHESVEDVFEPKKISKLHNEKVIKIAAGYAHSLVLTSDGCVYTFGCGLFGQLGHNDTKKSTVPVKVRLLDKPVRDISTGYFHNIAITHEDELYVWGCNPQVLRFEAQQKKREKLQNLRRERDLQQLQRQDSSQDEIQTNSTSATNLLKDIKNQARQALDEFRHHDSSNEQQSNGKVVKSLNQVNQSVNGVNSDNAGNSHGSQKANEDDDEQLVHLIPTKLDFSAVNGKVKKIGCGNQHTLILTVQGTVYAFGRNIDGQLGTNSRKEAKIPVVISAFKEDVINDIACGNDFSVAVSDSGTVFAWGSNSSGQLGMVPLEESSDSGSKVVVMKTTRRILRLQNNLQNSCDVPKPVNGIDSGVYPVSARLNVDTVGKECYKEIVNIKGAFEGFQNLPELMKFDHLLYMMIEKFFSHLDASQIIKKCLMTDNLRAAAKLSLLKGNILQAFEFSLQFGIKQNVMSRSFDRVNVISEDIFQKFRFYLSRTTGADEQFVEQRSQLLERLIACWQDQKFSFLLLESLCLKSEDPLLLQTLVLTLFCPHEERETHHGPNLDDESGPQLVDLFTPEFCLKLGDKFVNVVKQETFEGAQETQHRKASEMADNWLKKRLE